jgi:hypothetical protein
MDSEIGCPRCGETVPDLPFCIRCGASLEDGGKGDRRGRSAFAASPGESASRIAIISTLFPQLPAADLDTFRLAFAGGLVALLALALVGAFPVALVGAAVLVPALVLLYVYSVDVYEDTPLRVIALTMGWGAAWGAVSGFVTNAIADAGSVTGTPRLFDVLLFGAVVPLIGLALMIAGPLLLLRDRRFNDVLDGATFGVASAASFVAAQILVGSASLFAGGPTPIGEPVPWIGRILALGVALPVVAAGSVGSVVGAIWLRYRSPVRDRDALGMAGNPLVAVTIAAALLVAAALAAQLPGPILDVAVQLALAAIVLVWLRRTLHLGLLQEASEIEVGPEIRCANCDRSTPHHTFCGRCGIALRALPKRAGERRT